MTRRRCLNSEALADFVRGRRREDDERHVGECERCAARVALIRRIVAGGLGPIAETIDDVDALVSRFIAAPRNTWWKLVREAEYHRADVGRRLLALAIDARFRDRQLAVDLAKAATTIIEFLGSADAADLRFEGWKFCTAILREAGRYAELSTVFLRAAEAARATSNPEMAQASVCLSRALYYSEPDIWRPKKAAALLDRAERVFTAGGHDDRMQALRTARGLLLFRSGDMPAAREAFAGLLAMTAKTNRPAYLYALINLVAVRVELRESGPDIEQTLTLLIEENAAAKRSVPAARGRWLLGRVHLIRGEYDTAVALLTCGMEKIGDSDSSIRIGLDTLQALLLAGRFHEAYMLARDLASVAVALDRREPTRRHDLTAQVVAYLREAAQRQALTADLVTECAHYLDRITRRPAFAFVPPMPLTEM